MDRYTEAYTPRRAARRARMSIAEMALGRKFTLDQKSEAVEGYRFEDPKKATDSLAEAIKSLAVTCVDENLDQENQGNHENLNLTVTITDDQNQNVSSGTIVVGPVQKQTTTQASKPKPKNQRRTVFKFSSPTRKYDNFGKIYLKTNEQGKCSQGITRGILRTNQDGNRRKTLGSGVNFGKGAVDKKLPTKTGAKVLEKEPHPKKMPETPAVSVRLVWPKVS